VSLWLRALLGVTSDWQICDLQVPFSKQWLSVSEEVLLNSTGLVYVLPVKRWIFTIRVVWQQWCLSFPRADSIQVAMTTGLSEPYLTRIFLIRFSEEYNKIIIPHRIEVLKQGMLAAVISVRKENRAALCEISNFSYKWSRTSFGARTWHAFAWSPVFQNSKIRGSSTN
jgi:hypothetical protein